MCATWADIYAALNISPEFERLIKVINQESDRTMCDIVLASELIEGERSGIFRDRHVQAVQWAVKQGERRAECSAYLVLNTHRLMFPHGGMLRASGDQAILTSLQEVVTHQPPPGHKVSAALTEWCGKAAAFLQQAGSLTESDQYLGVAYYHLLFERDHFFNDGNGRVGRAIINYMCAYLGLSLVCVENRAEYILALNRGDLPRMVNTWRMVCP